MKCAGLVIERVKHMRKEKRALVALVLTKAFPFIERIKSVLRAVCQDPFLWPATPINLLVKWLRAIVPRLF